MNEFIVWDEENFGFLTNEDIFNDPELAIEVQENGSYLLINFGIEEAGVCCDDGYHEWEESFRREIEVKKFGYIGKTDKEGNKIYSDSSIIEFDFKGLVRTEKLKAFFSYSNVSLSYEIKIIDQRCAPSVWIDFISRVSNLKVIGTVQENPELLELNKVDSQAVEEEFKEFEARYLLALS